MAVHNRALRSNTKLISTAPPSLPSISSPRKRKAPAEVERFHCSSCTQDKPAKQFPDYNPTPTCTDHLINTCKTCLRKWVEHSIENANFKTTGDSEEGKVWGVQCPECDGIMRQVNIQHAAPKKFSLR